MASQYTVTVKIEKFIQRFLYAQFPQEFTEPGVFEFPARHDFNRLLAHLLMRCPSDYHTQDYGEETFRIRIPYMEHKNPATYNYLSEKRQIILQQRIKSFLVMLFNDALTESVKEHKFTREQAIDFMTEEFGFEAEDTDRLTKEYQRWWKNEKMRRFRKSGGFKRDEKKQKKCKESGELNVKKHTEALNHATW